MSAGGGRVRITAHDVTIDGAIRANGGPHYRGGAGGSVWIAASGNFGGGGVIEAKGGDSDNGEGGGGGGAIAVESATSSGTLPGKLQAWGGFEQQRRAARRRRHASSPAPPSQALGDLLVDAGSITGGTTVLPAPRQRHRRRRHPGRRCSTSAPAAGLFRRPLGRGQRRCRFAQGNLADRRSPGNRATLAPNGFETLDLLPGDKWQGVYRFGSVGQPAAR